MKAAVQDVQLLNNALEKRAKEVGAIGGTGSTRAVAQAEATYRLYLDFLEAGHLGLDFVRWLAKHSGLSHGTCWNRLKAGRARATGSKANRNQSGLIAEQRERELTPIAGIDWSADE